MNNVQIIRIGDCLPKGTFELHSLFNNVVNFSNLKGELVTFNLVLAIF